MNKIILKIVERFRWFFIRQGVDMDQLLAIVETKLEMDKRRVYMNWKQKQQKENRNHLRLILGAYLFYGALIGLMLYYLPSLQVNMILVHGFVLFMMCMTLVTDFSTVLLDTTDNQIILPRPVTSKTFFMARLIHIIAYILQFSLALCLIPVIVAFYKYGMVVGLVFIVTLMQTVLLAVFLTYMLYLLLIKFTSIDKIREMVTYFQIFMTVLFVGGFQILPRVINMNDLTGNFTLHAYSYFAPPVWMAYFVEAFHLLRFDGLHLLMIFLAILVPMACFLLLIKYLAPAFSAKIASMNTTSEPDQKTGGKKQTPISSVLSRLVCRQPIERSSFEMTWKITGRDKPFRLQFYPSLAYLAVFIFIFVFKSGGSMARLPETERFLWLIYFPILSIAGGIMLLGFNENYMASWIYYSMPVKNPGELITGSVKSLFIKYFLPIYCILFCFAFYIWGSKIIPDFILGFCNDLLAYLVIAYLSQHFLPFSRQPQTQQQVGRFLMIILQMIIIFGLVGLHFLVLHIPIVKYMLIPLSVVASWLIITGIRQLPWSKIVV